MDGRGAVGSGCWAGGRRCTSPRTRGTSSEGFDSGIVACPSPGFGFFLSGAGVDASEAVSVVPLVAAMSLFGFISFENLILKGLLSVGMF